jgi:hypothetical protein
VRARECGGRMFVSRCIMANRSALLGRADWTALTSALGGRDGT